MNYILKFYLYFSIHQFQQIGLLQRLMTKYLYRQNLRVRKTDVSPVTLQKITPILAFIGAGIIIAVIFLFIEKLYSIIVNYYHRFSQNSTHTQVNKQFNNSFTIKKKRRKNHSSLKFKAKNHSRKLPHFIKASYL